MLSWLVSQRPRISAHEGQGLLEYALILILVAMIVFVILAVMGPSLGNLYSNIISSI